MHSVKKNSFVLIRAVFEPLFVIKSCLSYLYTCINKIYFSFIHEFFFNKLDENMCLFQSKIAVKTVEFYVYVFQCLGGWEGSTECGP